MMHPGYKWNGQCYFTSCSSWSDDDEKLTGEGCLPIINTGSKFEEKASRTRTENAS